MVQLKDPSTPNRTDKEPDSLDDPISYEPPAILKAVEVGLASRRQFVLASLATVTAGCNAKASIETEGGVCTCHAVCTCDSDSSDSSNSSVRETTRDAVGNCTCNTVCTCNSVCTCDSQGSSGGGSDYWY
jgi:hypothetical protein